MTETAEPLVLPAGGKDDILSQDVIPTHMITTGKPGPTILVVGDSFTASFFPPMLAPHVGRAIWVHYNENECSFDWSLVDKYHPDEVWWAPVERMLICKSRDHAAAQAESAIIRTTRARRPARPSWFAASAGVSPSPLPNVGDGE